MSLRVLLSYWFFKDLDIEQLLAERLPDVKVDLIADSGAFSAHTTGAVIDVDEYAAWVKRWGHLFTGYFNLDVLYDPETTWRNQQYLEDEHGLSPIPIFHSVTEWEWLDRYLDAYNLVGLGGIALIRPQVRMPWLIKAFQRAKGRAVFHGLGVYNVSALAALPFYSVDSSSWCSIVQYGNIKLFDPQTGKRVLLRLGDHRNVYGNAGLIRRYGFDPADFADRSRMSRTTCLALGMTNVIETERWLRRRHGAVTLPERDGLRGPRLNSTDDGPRNYCVEASDDTQDAVIGLRAAPGGPKTYCVEAFMEIRQIEEVVTGLTDHGLTRYLDTEVPQ